MCRSMVDIHSATTEIRGGKKEERRRIGEETTGQKYNGLPYSIGPRAAITNPCCASINSKTPFTRYNLLSNRLYNRFDNMFKRVNGVYESQKEIAMVWHGYFE